MSCDFASERSQDADFAPATQAAILAFARSKLDDAQLADEYAGQRLVASKVSLEEAQPQLALSSLMPRWSVTWLLKSRSRESLCFCKLALCI